MSFFDDASLAFLPSGGAGKDGKAYSIKPTDGTGDFTFSRGSNLTATRVGPTGLIEKGRENLLTYSNDLTNSVWAKQRLTAATESSVFPTGFSSSNKILETAVTGQHYVRQSHTGISGAVYTASCYIKGIGRNYANIEVLSLSSPYELYLAEINLTNGSITTSFSGGTAIDAVAIDLGDGWYRISITGLISGKTNFAVQVYPLDDSKNGAYAGDITKGLYVAGFQFENSLAATDYIESGASTGKAGLLENEPRFDYSGGATCPSLLLEPQRVNLVSQSEYFDAWSGSRIILDINTSETLSPEGLNNATGFIATAVNDDHARGISVTIPAGAVTYSAYLKAGDKTWARLWEVNVDNVYVDFNLSGSGSMGTTQGTFLDKGIEAVGNGWYRCYMSVTSTGGGGTFRIYPLEGDGDKAYLGDGSTIDLYTYGAQLEAGSYPTSYIPNHSGGSATRTLESATRDISSIVNSPEGTIFCEFAKIEDFDSFQLDDSTINNRITLYPRNDTATITFILQVGGVEVVRENPKPTGLDTTQFNKYAIAWGLNDFRVYVNGVNIYTSTSNITFGSGVLTDLDFYRFNNKQLLLFPTALSDADMITLTT